MRVGPFELDDAKVNEARVRFEANAIYRNKDRMTFDEYLKLFASDCNSFKNISEDRLEQQRISGEMVRLVYKRYFANLFPRRLNGRVRKGFCDLKTAKIKAKELPEDGLLRDIAEEASKNGLTFEKERIGRVTAVLFKGRTILLNGKRCCISCIVNKWRPSPRGHRFFAHAGFSVAKLSQHDFLIIKTAVVDYSERYFIIPTAEIFRYSGSSWRRYLYLPLKKLPVYNNHRPKIDWWQYENAWHLLKEPDIAQVTVIDV